MYESSDTILKEHLSRSLMGNWRVNADHKCVMFLNPTLTLSGPVGDCYLFP